MGKPGSNGALLKQPASQVSSNDGPLLSGAAVEELEATRNINDFRKRARELGLVTHHRNSDGGYRKRSREDILESGRRVLNGVPDFAGGHPALKRPASSTFGHEFHSSKEATAPLQSIGDIDHFRQRVRAFGVPFNTVMHQANGSIAAKQTCWKIVGDGKGTKQGSALVELLGVKLCILLQIVTSQCTSGKKVLCQRCLPSSEA